MKDTIAVIGLGKLGAPLLAVFAESGFETIGADLNPEVVAAINAGRAPVDEPLLQDYLDRAKGFYRATTSVREAAEAANLIFMIVPTPSGKDNTFQLDYVLRACDEIAPALADGAAWKCVVIVSTVMPGSMEVIRRRLESESGLACGRDFSLVYSPEFIALGEVIRYMLHPDFILIGQQDGDKFGAELLAQTWRAVCLNHPAIERMNWVSAELAKLCLNAYITMKISYANQIAMLCQAIPGADVDIVMGAIGQDSRVGRKCLKGGMAFGGPCFPRDVRALLALGDALNVDLPLAHGVEVVNEAMVLRLAAAISETMPERVAVLGLAYKAGTGVVEESPALRLIYLISEWTRVLCYDPQAELPAGYEAEQVDSQDEAVKGADVIVIATPWPEFVALKAADLSNAVVIDPWRMLAGADLNCRAYIPVGVGEEPPLTPTLPPIKRGRDEGEAVFA